MNARVEAFTFGELGGLELAATAGRPKILWIHGYTLDATVWPAVWARMPDHHHVGVDLPGHGRSRAMRRGETLSSVAAELASLCRAWSVEHVIALSFGGMVGLQLAAEPAAGFTSVSLVSPGLAGGPVDPQAQTCNLELGRMYRERGPGSWLVERWMAVPPDIFAGARRHPELFERLRAIIERHRWDELESGAMQGLLSERQTPELLGKIKARTQVIVGEEDMASFKRCAALIARGIGGGCRRRYVAKAGHLSVLEVPDAVAPLLVESIAG